MKEAVTKVMDTLIKEDFHYLMMLVLYLYWPTKAKTLLIGFTLNCIGWWGSSSEALRCVQSLFRCHYSQIHSDQGCVYKSNKSVKFRMILKYINSLAFQTFVWFV